MWIVCADLEGVFVPEIWINVALKTGIDELKLTTRDIKDYNQLMNYRLKILDQHNLKLKDIQDVISTLDPLPGALDFIREMRRKVRFSIISDTFVEFAGPLMDKLENPFLLCHNLITDPSGKITGYKLRQDDPKRKSVQAFKSLKYDVLAFGDSYNDVTMLQEADKGILFCPPDNVAADFPQFPVVRNLNDLKSEIYKIIN